MSQIDSNRVAAALAYCEAHCDSKAETDIVVWVTEHVGDTIKRGHPRFNIGKFQIQANPIRSRELRSRILASVGKSS